MDLPFQTIKRELLVRRESVGNFGNSPSERTARDIINYGIVNIDKPKGPTSHQVSDFVKKILNIGKAGHSGTLDPGVTGVLPVALGRATRIVQALLPAGKEYIALGYIHKPVSEQRIRQAFAELTGKITQKPPVKSAVRRVERTREIYYVDILEIDGQDVLFRIGCQAGTYIRKYIHDLGLRLGCGAHMEELRRTKVASFDESTLATLQDLTDAYHFFRQGNDKFIKKIVQPVENAVNHLPKVYILDSTIEPLSHGRDLAVPGISMVESGIRQQELVAIMTLKGELVAMGPSALTSEEMVRNEKGIAVKTDKVFMHE
ncbi:MAG TPA: RNA-guided pseudouridylation complex pseudouridine synthase subunit Cbf5 [Candidatus Nanoarchaeia archaeon]|nr:RNA-guided pseudouridylation complex pseudouridine synthase subunit Cbf5 [Candidatus Nanoarchaeia archaeon]